MAPAGNCGGGVPSAGPEDRRTANETGAAGTPLDAAVDGLHRIAGRRVAGNGVASAGHAAAEPAPLAAAHLAGCSS